MRTSTLTLLFLALLPASALADKSARSTKTSATLDVKSSAFDNNEAIPAEFTCEGTEVSPPLSWSKVPAATKSIAILAEDPDAPKGTFTHWLVTGIPSTTTSLDRGAALPEGAIAQANDKGN